PAPALPPLPPPAVLSVAPPLPIPTPAAYSTLFRPASLDVTSSVFGLVCSTPTTGATTSAVTVSRPVLPAASVTSTVISSPSTNGRSKVISTVPFTVAVPVPITTSAAPIITLWPPSLVV